MDPFLVQLPASLKIYWKLGNEFPNSVGCLLHFRRATAISVHLLSNYNGVSKPNLNTHKTSMSPESYKNALYKNPLYETSCLVYTWLILELIIIFCFLTWFLGCVYNEKKIVFRWTGVSIFCFKKALLKK